MSIRLNIRLNVLPIAWNNDLIQFITMPKTNSLPKRLTEKCETLLLMGVKQVGSYDVEKVMPFIEEELTLKDNHTASAFLNWVVKNDKQFGHGNIQEVYKEFRDSL